MICRFQKFSRFLNIIRYLTYDSETNVANGNNIDEKIITWQEEKEKFIFMSSDEKRKHYKCKDKYVTLNDIPTWRDYFINNRQNIQDLNILDLNFEIDKINEAKNKELSEKVSLWYGSMTILEVEAIVAPTTVNLQVRGAASSAIQNSVGPYLQMEKDSLKECPVGRAKITGGYELPAKYVIHTAGPAGEYPELLKSCYEECLELVGYHQFSSVAFPCISTGVLNYPNLEAARIATSVTRLFMERTGQYLQRIIFAVSTEKDYRLYERLLQIFFPC